MLANAHAKRTQRGRQAVAAPFQLRVGQARLAVRHGDVVRPVAGTSGNDRSKVHVIVLVDRKTSTMLTSCARADEMPDSDVAHTFIGWRTASGRRQLVSFSPEAISRELTKRKVFVALFGDDIVGTAGLDGEVVRSVFVDPARQKRGIGRHLMDVIHTAAVSAGVEAVRVPSSITAEEFYTALGYEKIRDVFHGAERTIVMEKRLG